MNTKSKSKFISRVAPFVIAAPIILAVSCQKENNDNKVQKAFDNKAKNVRMAAKNAYGTPYDISNLYEDAMKEASQRLNINPTQIADSSKVFMKAVEVLKEWYGNPLPKNEETSNTLYLTADDLVKYYNQNKNQIKF